MAYSSISWLKIMLFALKMQANSVGQVRPFPASHRTAIVVATKTVWHIRNIWHTPILPATKSRAQILPSKPVLFQPSASPGTAPLSHSAPHRLAICQLMPHGRRGSNPSDIDCGLLKNVRKALVELGEVAANIFKQRIMRHLMVKWPPLSTYLTRPQSSSSTRIARK